MISNSNNYRSKLNTKKLLIIGNGFDLHQHLASSFDDFFSSKDYFEDFISDDGDLSDSFDYIADISDGKYHEKDPINYPSPIVHIKQNTEFCFYFSKYHSSFQKDQNGNFWATYFKSLEGFPQFANGNAAFEFQSPHQALENWSDIEYQISYLLQHTENTLNLFSICASLDYIEANEKQNKNIQEALNKYESSFLSNGRFTFNSVISFLTIFDSLKTGWHPRKENIYDYLFSQLQEFEKMFGDYLRKQVETAKENNEYTKKSQEFAKKLANDPNYNLLNFNYTTFYDTSNSSKTNIHSTLGDGGHPIFGISSDLGNNKLIYQKPYYRFSKAYRIMKLTNDNSIKNILPKNIDEIIFYGQSLSHADYLYFDTIFSEYKIYDSDSKVKLTFKYSNFDATANVEQQQINIIYKLINQFSNHINMYNLLTKLLLENRLNIEEVQENNDI